MTDNSRLEDLEPGILDIGKRAYFESTPTDEFENGRIWQNYRWGHSVEFFILDCRQERVPDQGQYISPKQMAWLKDALAQSPATLRCF